jgi:hypothetical protein
MISISYILPRQNIFTCMKFLEMILLKQINIIHSMMEYLRCSLRKKRRGDSSPGLIFFPKNF